jgi:hypothetical protein
MSAIVVVPKKAQFTHDRVEYPLKAPNRQVVTFIKIRSHRKKFSNSDSVKQKIKLLEAKLLWIHNFIL